ncbi:MAG: UDP-N-acetylmuramoyl-L-alanyl-D-glutamate--2,6-diaminopimelate ligase [bacterium]
MIQYDSRKIQPGDTFVAIPGFKVDGYDFITQAIENGAKEIVAEREYAVPVGVKFQKVPSSRQALAHLAAKFYDNPSTKVKLIGITGTNGKTTTAYLIKSILETAGYKTGIIGTIDNQLTTPESLELQALLAEMVKQGMTHVVMEVSSHALAQDRVYGLNFDIAIFTNFTHDHLDFHKTRKEYLEAKLKLFKMLKGDDIAIINVDDPASNFFITEVAGEIITYGVTQARRELREAKHNEYDAEVSSILIRPGQMTLSINSFNLKTPLLGMPNVYNILAAYNCGVCFNILPKTIIKGIEALKSVPGRFERVDCGQPFQVIVDFAHSPDALQKLIETYRPLTKEKIVLVFGCPGDRDRAKRPIMGKIAVEFADKVIITTDDPHTEDPKKIIEEIGVGEKIVDRKEAIKKALILAKKGDTVLIAGRGHEKDPFDDRDVVRDFFLAVKFVA